MGGMLQRLGLKPGEAIVHPWINKALAGAQKKVEARNFDTRKNLLKYDDVMNDQRKEVYGQRREFMSTDDVSDTVAHMRDEVIGKHVALRIPERSFAEQWEAAELADDMRRIFALDLPVADWAREDGMDSETVAARIDAAAASAMALKAANYGATVLRFVEKQVLLTTLDAVWKEHLLALDQLRQGIYLRAHGQRDPLNEYKREAFALFNAMLDELRERVTSMLAHVEISTGAPLPVPPELEVPPPTQLAPTYAAFAPEDGEVLEAPPIDFADPETWRAMPRNAPCPCGSGRKYKHCHGRDV